MKIKISDNRVHNFWRCNIKGCDAKPEQRVAVVTPDWYEQNGTPVCPCGEDMEYSHTEVDM